MFNFIVAGGGWSGRRDDFPASRIVLAEDQLPWARTGDAFNFEALRALPTLFVAETDERQADQTARVGEIDFIRQVGNSVHIEYHYLDRIAPIPQAELEGMAPALGIYVPRSGIGPFQRTHWQIPAADLFKVLMTEQNSNIRSPSVFRIPQHQVIDSNLLSAMMPFAGFGPVWEAIQRAADANGMRSGRADITWEHAEIMQDVASLIDRAAIVVCDCTNKNANVFYEMGIAHSLGKEVIIITQNPQDVPFDITHLRHIRYYPNGEGLQSLEQQLISRIGAIRSRLA